MIMFHVNLPGCIVVLFVFGKGIIDILFFWGEYVCADMSIYMIQHVCIYSHAHEQLLRQNIRSPSLVAIPRQEMAGASLRLKFCIPICPCFVDALNLKHATWPGVVKHLRITFKCHTNGVPGPKAYVSKFICFDIVGRYLREN